MHRRSEKLIFNPYWQFLSHLKRSHCEGKTVLMQLLEYGEDPRTTTIITAGKEP